MTTLGSLVNKTMSMEDVRNKMKARDDSQKGSLGKRPYGFFESKKFEVGSGSGSNKNLLLEKAPYQVQGQSQGSGRPGNGAKGQKCDRCLGPHTL